MTPLLLAVILLTALETALHRSATAMADPRDRVNVEPGDVVINEVAWMGTLADYRDEWIELYNTTGAPVTLTGWTLAAEDGNPLILLTGTILPGGYYLLERTDDSTVDDVPADLIYTGALENDPGAEILRLYDDGGGLIDTANGDGGTWPGGDNGTKHSMERRDPTAPDSDSNWATHAGTYQTGVDAAGNPIPGTPKAQNASFTGLPDVTALWLVKIGPPTATSGTLLTYSVTLSNTGTTTLYGVRLTDTLPAPVQFVDQDSPYPFEASQDGLLWSIGTLVPREGTTRLTVTGQLTTGAWGTVANAVTATGLTSQGLQISTTARWSTEIRVQPQVLINAVYYDGYQTGDTDEAVQLVNVGATPISLAGWQLADGATSALLPAYVLAPGQTLWIARDGLAFAESFGFAPDLDQADLDGAWPGLANGDAPGQDEVILRDDQGQLVDVLIYETGDAQVGGWDGPAVQPWSLGAGTGQILYRKPDEATGLPAADTDSATDWAQDETDHLAGRRVRYPGWESFLFWPLQATEPASLTIAVAPDAAYGLVYEAISQARSRIRIASYTFEHARLAEAVAAKAAQGVSVTVLLEGEPVQGVQHQERWVCQQIETAGGQCWFMHNYAPGQIYDRYDQMHAKYLIVDDRWVLIGSENLNPTGLPDDDKADGTAGRRGLWVKTDAPSVVAHAATIFESDCAPLHHRDMFRWQPVPFVSGSDRPTDTFGLPPPSYTPVYTSGGVSYTARFSRPLHLSGSFNFELFTAPDAALRQRDALLGLLAQAGAGDEIYVEMLYERSHWGTQAGDTPLSAPNPRLMAYLAAARRGARVRILLDRHFDQSYESWSNAATAAYLREMAGREGLDLQVALGDPTGGGLHNKMLLARIGGRGIVHLGSLNGSEASHKINRELILQMESEVAYNYLKTVFEGDWYTSQVIYLPLVTHQWAPPAPPVPYPVISEVLYDPPGAEDGGEWIEIYNPTAHSQSLAGWYLGDVGPGGEFGSGLYTFPPGTLLAPGAVLLVARQAADTVGLAPDLEFLIDPLRDTTEVPNMHPAGNWEGFGLALGNGGDEVILLDEAGEGVDVLVYGAGQYPDVVPHPGVGQAGHSLERRPAGYDTNDCSQDFVERYPPAPGAVD
jgi:uncharacterized repeat protein (TIGR01451 family)